MQSILCIPLGIIVERAAGSGGWQAQAWRVSSVLVGPSRLPPGSPLWRDNDAGYFFAGIGILSLYPKAVGSYRANLQQAIPRLYVVLTAQEGDAKPPTVHLLTAAPEEAQSYDVDSKLISVSPLAMSKQLRYLVAAYIKEHAAPRTPAAGGPQPKLDQTGGGR